jgi:hypothetical protein
VDVAVYTAQVINAHDLLENRDVLQFIYLYPHGDASIINQHVNLPIITRGCLHNCLTLRLVANIHWENLRLPAQAPALDGGRFQFNLVARSQHEASFRAGKLAGHFSANAAGGASDDDYLVFENFYI